MKFKKIKIDNVNLSRYNQLRREGIVRRKIISDGIEKVIIASDKDAD